MRTRKGKDRVAPPGSPDVTCAVTHTLAARQEAFRCFVEPEIEVLLRVAQTLTGSWSDSEDLVQDTLIRAYKGIDGFDGAHPRAWLMTILRNAHINSHRRQRPDLLDEPADLDHHRPAFGTATVPSPEQSVADQVFDEDLQQAIDSLDPRFRTVLLLIDVDQLTYAEVAELLGIPVGTVMSRLSRARGRIRVHLRTSKPPRRNP